VGPVLQGPRRRERRGRRRERRAAVRGINDISFHVRVRYADRYARVPLVIDERGDLVDGFILPTLDPMKPKEDRLPEVVMNEFAHAGDRPARRAARGRGSLLGRRP